MKHNLLAFPRFFSEVNVLKVLIILRNKANFAELHKMQNFSINSSLILSRISRSLLGSIYSTSCLWNISANRISMYLIITASDFPLLCILKTLDA